LPVPSYSQLIFLLDPAHCLRGAALMSVACQSQYVAVCIVSYGIHAVFANLHGIYPAIARARMLKDSPVPEAIELIVAVGGALQREISVEALAKVARFFGLTVDQVINLKGQGTSEDKTTSDIAELDEKDKSIVFGMIETMLTKKKFKDFFNKNVAAL
jgi:hypothetical protein